ncbi:MAG: hypothetical protein LN569_05360 [Rickettsia endosymbiont of Labidopullus appendiculatus]|nr:hypothetical protein [Rickettsia endosymbiont of Labidopullus appendiculatus]
MVYLNNKNENSALLKNNNTFSGNNWKNIVEEFVAFGVLAAVAIALYGGLCKIMEIIRFHYDSNNPAEEFPLQQGMMNGNIPNNRNDNIEVQLIAENGED